MNYPLAEEERNFLEKMSKTCSFPISSLETVSFCDRPKRDIK